MEESIPNLQEDESQTHINVEMEKMIRDIKKFLHIWLKQWEVYEYIRVAYFQRGCWKFD